MKTLELLIKFAKRQPKINAIYRGGSPEDENHKIYYFIIPPPYDFELSDKITDLDIRIANKTTERCELLQWSIPLEEISNYPFLEKCIWKRDLV